MTVLQTAFRVIWGLLLWVILAFDMMTRWFNSSWRRRRQHVGSEQERWEIGRFVALTVSCNQKWKKILKQTLTFDRVVWACLLCSVLNWTVKFAVFSSVLSPAISCELVIIDSCVPLTPVCALQKFRRTDWMRVNEVRFRASGVTVSTVGLSHCCTDVVKTNIKTFMTSIAESTCTITMWT